ncbi:MtrAB system histidine kinase MtrB [Streptomyces zagrosensis]|uniref:Sensor histidine kinase MtrB n=1 Tax=Streptomyces zagrosensis TaxID=1042984 RepID=A0A7W9Q812_9ACTN|nr:MtrAB system histidine kinase MtrB [Streptomyces zagrosensis]MBB5935303.1 two-component system sensor histidine kinase MtrB [Streptomyces zagrosensis]
MDSGSDISLFGRLWRGGHLLPDGASGAPVHPVLRLFVRWVRRPLLPAARLYRRNIQLRVVATTLLMSLGVVLLLGVVVIGQVRNGLLDAKRHAAQSQAAGGFSAAVDAAESSDDPRSGEDGGTGARGNRDAGAWLTALVQQLASGGQGVYSVVALSSEGDGEPFVSTRGPRASGGIQPEESVSQRLRDRVDQDAGTHEQYTNIVHDASGEREPALVIGKRLSDINGDAYQLYYLFPFSQEEKSLSLVKGTLATAGVFVVVLLGAIAWLVVRQVVTPVRMAAGISERLAAGLLQERMKVTGEDDIARLGEAFNKMAHNLQVKIQQLEDLSRMQRRFVSDVSHELRTPLTTVRMAADVIYEARDEFDPATARSAELLGGQLDRFESLLADLLEISRFDAGAAALEAEPIDLRDVVKRVVEGAEPLAERKGSRIVVRGASRPVIAEADARRVERVLRNLVVNAVEHGEGEDVVVRLAAKSGAVAVAVRDYGVGLKPGEATRVFNRFWRADPARARTTGGTGLGLSIAEEDARLHDGWLQAWGEPGGGSQFRLTLPRTAGDALRGSPIPLEPEDSRRKRALRAAKAAGGAGSSRVTGGSHVAGGGQVTGGGGTSGSGVSSGRSGHHGADGAGSAGDVGADRGAGGSGDVRDAGEVSGSHQTGDTGGSGGSGGEEATRGASGVGGTGAHRVAGSVASVLVPNRSDHPPAVDPTALPGHGARVVQRGAVAGDDAGIGRGGGAEREGGPGHEGSFGRGADAGCPDREGTAE